jgi:hypothetical protein
MIPRLLLLLLHLPRLLLLHLHLPRLLRLHARPHLHLHLHPSPRLRLRLHLRRLSGREAFFRWQLSSRQCVDASLLRHHLRRLLPTTTRLPGRERARPRRQDGACSGQADPACHLAHLVGSGVRKVGRLREVRARLRARLIRDGLRGGLGSLGC